MAITSGDVIRLTLEYFYPGAGTAMNVFHYAFLGADQDEQDIIDALVTWVSDEWGAHWKDLASTSAELANAVFEVVDVDGHVLADLGTEVIGQAGEFASEVSPAAVSAHLTANTATPGVRGSKYIPGIAEGAVDSGTFNAAALADIALMLLDYMETVNVSAGNNLFPVVRSTKLAGFPRLITAGTINTLPAYQRRRKAGVGI